MPYLAKEHVNISTKDLLSWAFDAPPYDEEKPIYIDASDSSKFINGRQAKSIIRKPIAGLRRSGIRKGDCVCVHSFNRLYYPMLVLGIVGSGGVFTGTNPAYTPTELAHHIKVTRARMIIVEPELLENVITSVNETSMAKSNILIFNETDQLPPPAYRSWTRLLEAGEEDWVRFDDYETARTTTAMLLSTSGTTGLPKAAMISHHNLAAEHTLFHEWKPVAHDVRRLIALPIFHAAMAPTCHTSALRSGHITFIMRRFDVEEFMAAIEKHQIHDLVLVPPVIIRIIMSPLRKKYSLKSIKYALVGAAPLDAGPQMRFKELLGDGASCNQVWGMTETCCAMTKTPYPEHDDSGSCGRMFPNCDVKFVDDDGYEITSPNPRGEMCIRGPVVIRGYYENPEANARDFDADGYFHTGDIAQFNDETEQIFIVDRKKELIKVRSFQVAPGEIEGILLMHPSIVDVAVIGLQLPSSPEAELPRAYVVLVPGEKLTEKEVVEFAGSKLAKYKRLEGGVKFVDAIPKTASGKILKRLLRESAAKEISAKL